MPGSQKHIVRGGQDRASGSSARVAASVCACCMAPASSGPDAPNNTFGWREHGAPAGVATQRIALRSSAVAGPGAARTAGRGCLLLPAPLLGAPSSHRGGSRPGAGGVEAPPRPSSALPAPPAMGTGMACNRRGPPGAARRLRMARAHGRPAVPPARLPRPAGGEPR